MLGHFFLIEREIEMRQQEALREAEKRRLLREARVDQQGWLSRQRYWLLGQLGRLLVTLGQQLQRYGQPQTMLLEGQINGGVSSGNGEIRF